MTAFINGSFERWETKKSRRSNKSIRMPGTNDPHKRFESSAGPNEVGNSKGRIISRRKLAIRPSKMTLRCDELHGHGWYDSELQIT
jgi:hypothetical protein